MTQKLVNFTILTKKIRHVSTLVVIIIFAVVESRRAKRMGKRVNPFLFLGGPINALYFFKPVFGVTA